ncbi:hypothetical protein T12_16090 [Trichinella patagoniensis]|uniref:Uncharacterized protein n=1 Tax=Trichinella patagoniensis TaxID=990121 RepID=A0A0V0ZK50_9BILA|nr:hypothetical protein T12_16090 [Trichinella patagoniensis]
MRCSGTALTCLLQLFLVATLLLTETLLLHFISNLKSRIVPRERRFLYIYVMDRLLNMLDQKALMVETMKEVEEAASSALADKVRCILLRIHKRLFSLIIINVLTIMQNKTHFTISSVYNVFFIGFFKICAMAPIYTIVADVDRDNKFIPAENEEEERSETKYGSSCLPEDVAVGKLPGKRFVVTSSVLAFDCLIKYILIVCRLIVAMPSGKRETERKGNAPVNTGPSPNRDGCTNNTVEEAEEHFNQ